MWHGKLPSLALLRGFSGLSFLERLLNAAKKHQKLNKNKPATREGQPIHWLCSLAAVSARLRGV
jgi:hypothetical protein